MFVEHKELKVLNLPASRVARLNSSGCNVQMAFPGFPPQMCAAYLVSISSGSKVLILVAFYLSESRQTIFFVPKAGEVPVEVAEKTFEDGFVFAESMGFVLNETDFHLLSTDDQKKLWASLPICQTGASVTRTPPQQKIEKVEIREAAADPLEEYRERSLKSLGRFLSSL